VLERDDRPGGLVRTECYDGFYFDRVLHVLYFSDEATETRIKQLLGDDLASCPPTAWVETAFGTVGFPFQMHLGELAPDAAVRCLYDLAKVTFTEKRCPPTNFEETLLQTFGQGICDVFLFPYNRKVWKRSLDTLAPSEFQWTITHPDFEKVLSGLVSQNYQFNAYNSIGWYPRPHQDEPIRGMEVLTRTLAQNCADIRLNHTVESIDLDTRTVIARCNGEEVGLTYDRECVSSLPLPQLIKMCKQVPEDLHSSCLKLTRNRVLSAMFSIRGERPTGRGHWLYYADESIIFSRLVYMHEFDPFSAPEDGWGLLVEVIQPAEEPTVDAQEILSVIEQDLHRVDALSGDCQIIDAHLMIVDPAYVVFTLENQSIIKQARKYFESKNITLLGRYGRWEYSSMAQVMRDGFLCGKEIADRHL
jgi:protoporphyrinogen oxidase